MEQIDAGAEAMLRSEAGSGARLLEFCAATASPKPPVPAPLIPISILGFSVLYMATGFGLFAFIPGAIIIASVIFFFTHFKHYLVAVTESELVLVQVTMNLLTRVNSRKLRYGEIRSVTAAGKPPNVGIEIEAAGETLKLQLLARLPKLSNSEARVANFGRILREKVQTPAQGK